MLKNNIKNISVLSKESNIPYTTLKNFYTRGTENVGLSTLKKIADFFDVTLDYLVYGANHLGFFFCAELLCLLGKL